MQITRKPYARLNGTEIDLFTLTNHNGLKAEIINYGGIIVSLWAPDRSGQQADITLGYDDLDSYLDRSPCFGAIIGRHANRIEDACFTLNGITYQLNKNEGENQLHGGLKGFHKMIWDAEIIGETDNQSLRLKYRSPDGEEHYPGNLDVTVIYSLNEDNALVIEYTAVSDKDTVVNLTNHAYFNLSGHDSGDVLDHQLMIRASRFTVISKACIPTGEIRDVKGTPMDFTRLKTVGSGILNNMDDEQMKNGNGYDHNWVLDVSGKEAEKAAELYDPKSGRLMEVYTTKPGIQFYSGNYLKSAGKGKGGVEYENRSGLCLETQFFPNAMKHSHFPSPILKAGEVYHHVTIYRFGTR